MPRWASRLTLVLTEVRVERVQECSFDDCLDEGIERHPPMEPGEVEQFGGAGSLEFSPQAAFRKLWNDTNGAGAWERNDWVWALTFKVHRHNVDTFIQRVTAHETGCRPLRETA